VSLVCQQIKEEYQAWAQRRLDAITLDYLFLDASFFRMHPGSPAEPVLAAWGITTDGKPAFIGLAPGTGESADAWHAFLADLKDRGLASPLLVISDGAPGLIAAIEQAYPKALRQRCLIHRARNILAKIPAGMQAEVKDAYWKISGTEDLKTPPGPKLVEIIDARIGDLAAKYQGIYPAAAKVLLTGREGLTAYLLVPRRTPPSHPALQLHMGAPSARPADGSRSSAGSPARPPASPWSGPCSTGPPAAGAV
jgi:putative transposase